MKKVITILLSAFMGIVAYTTTLAQLPTSGLVASYPFNANVNDESMNNHNGTNNGAALVADRFGNTDNAYSFNGTSNFISVSSFPQFFTGNFSISIWLKNLGDLGSRTYDGFISMGTSTSNHSFNFAFDRPNTNFSYWDITNGSYYFTDGASSVKDAWAHIVIVYNNNVVTNYVNNVAVSTKTVSNIIPRSSQQLNIGAFAADLQYFLGHIDDIAIYSRALSTSEIASLYSYAKPITPTWVTAYAPASICAQSVTYQVNSVTNATQYIWMVDGVTVQTSSSTQYTKIWANTDAGTHTISVIAKDGLGGQSPTLVSSPITVYAPLSAPAAISGNNTICLGTSAVTSTYSVAAVAGAQSYLWKLNGNTLTAATNSADITFSTAQNGQSVSVQAVNLCGNSSATTLSVDAKSIPAVPTQIIAEGTYCYNSKVNILTTPVAGATSYEWKVNSTTTRPETGLYIGADFSALSSGFIVGSNNVSVAALNGTCKGTPYTTAITLNSVPTDYVINGSESVCPYKYATYTVSPDNAQVGYFWKVLSPDPTVNYQNNANTLRVNFPDSPGNTYVLQVTVSNNCGNGIFQKTVQLVNNTPTAIPIISCVAKTGNVCNTLGFSSSTVVPTGTAISWNIDGSSVPSLNNSTTINLASNPGTTYTATLTNNGCSYTNHFGECQPVVQGQSARMAAEEIATSPSAVTVYPNPNSGSFIIETDGAVGTAYVINTSGQLVETVTLEKGGFVTSVKLSATGLYVVKVKTATANKTFKVSVE